MTRTVTVPPGTRITARPATDTEARDLDITPGTWIVVTEYEGTTQIYAVGEVVIVTTGQ